MTDSLILRADDGPIATLTLNSPGSLNALSTPMLQALDAAWEEEEVRFGPGTQGQGACGHEGLIAKLRHARRAVNPAPTPLP